MSIKVNIDEIENDQRDQINEKLMIKIEDEKGFAPPRSFFLPEIIGDYIYLPFSYSTNVLKRKRRKRDEFPPMDIKFNGTLRPEQKIVKSEAIEHLNKTGSVIISAYCGFGKSFTALSIAQAIKLKTLIIVNGLVLIDQWIDDIKTIFDGASVQLIETKTKKKDSDFYIMNAINVKKMGEDFFKDIGLVICDEIHLIMAEKLSSCMQFIFPRYLIGLSATPYREDGLDILLELYFGKNKIIRELHRKHVVLQVNTGFKIPMEKTSQGRVNWGAVLKHQSDSSVRNDFIVKLIQEFPKRNFLVLTKRVTQARSLVKKLKAVGESVTSLIGSEKKFDKEARILVAIPKKCGTGFNHPKLDALMLCSDIEAYFIQVLGRVFRREDSSPVIFDLVDDNFILHKHFETRKGVYEKIGGVIKNFFKEFPEFEKIN